MRKYISISVITLLSFFFISFSTADKATRQQQKALDAALDSIRAESAMNALKANDFLLQADRITFKHGSTFTVNSTINFISRRGDKGVVQIASPVASPGPNGIGGLTLNGTVRNSRLTFDKKGNATLSYILSGLGLTADITIKLPAGHSTAIATVDAGYSTAGMIVEGKITPYDDLKVVKGDSY